MQQLQDRISGHRGWMNRQKPKDLDSQFKDEDGADDLIQHICSLFYEYVNLIRSIIWNMSEFL